MLTAHACPYPELAEEDRTICSLEKMLFSELLRQDVDLCNAGWTVLLPADSSQPEFPRRLCPWQRLAGATAVQPAGNWVYYCFSLAASVAFSTERALMSS